MKNRIKDSLAYIVVFLMFGYIFSEVLDFMEREDISNIGHRLTKVEEFVLYSYGKKNYRASGDYIIDYRDKMYIGNPAIDIYSDQESSHIKSKEALYYPNDNLLKLFKDVEVRSGKTILETSYLNIMTEKSIAYNHTENMVLLDSVKMYGRNLFFEFKSRNLFLEKVKTEVYGSDG